MSELMSCEQARDLMLEADLDELRGTGDSPLARHVRNCGECAGFANRILESYGKMDNGLVSIHAAQLDIVPIRKRRSLGWMSAPVAAAAVIALLVIARQNDPLPNVNGVARLMFSDAPIVAPRAGQQAMVIQKKEMTIVWLYQQETR